jgi:hypothetical protein
MKLMKAAIVLLVLVSFPLTAFADSATAPGGKVSAQSFKLRYKDAERAAAVIKTLVGPEATVSIQPGSNTLTVTDQPEKLKAVAAAIAAFDSPAKSFVVEVRLVSASRTNGPMVVPEDLKEISAKLSGVLRFNVFEKIGDMSTEGKEGDPVVIEPAKGYRAEFKVGEYDPVTDTIKLNDFSLARAGADKELTSLMKMTLNLRLGQTVVFGASKSADSQKVLMLVLSAKKK